MANGFLPDSESAFDNRVIRLAVKLLAFGFLLWWTYGIIEVFLLPAIWGGILAIVLYPLFNRFSAFLGNRRGLAATLMVLIILLVIIGPTVWVVLSSVDDVRGVIQAYRDGKLVVPPPPEGVASWPIIGYRLQAAWAEAAVDTGGFLAAHQEELKDALVRLLSGVLETGRGIAIFAMAIGISGGILYYSERLSQRLRALLVKLGGDRGESMADMTVSTVRNVVKGILGVAFIQGIMAGAGMVLAGVPLAGLWALLCMLLSVVQIGIFPVVIGCIVYIWSAADQTTAIALTVWLVIVSLTDNVLKPLLLGKGAQVPMLVVFVGAIGGFLHSGFLGLFTGAVVLSLGYRIYDDWIEARVAEQNV